MTSIIFLTCPKLGSLSLCSCSELCCLDSVGRTWHVQMHGHLWDGFLESDFAPAHCLSAVLPQKIL